MTHIGSPCTLETPEPVPKSRKRVRRTSGDDALTAVPKLQVSKSEWGPGKANNQLGLGSEPHSAPDAKKKANPPSHPDLTVKDRQSIVSDLYEMLPEVLRPAVIPAVRPMPAPKVFKPGEATMTLGKAFGEGSVERREGNPTARSGREPHIPKGKNHVRNEKKRAGFLNPDTPNQKLSDSKLQTLMAGAVKTAEAAGTTTNICSNGVTGVIDTNVTFQLTEDGKADMEWLQKGHGFGYLDRKDVL